MSFWLMKIALTGMKEAASALGILEGVLTDMKSKDGALVDEFELPQIPAS
jgi:hypothetical protein